MSHFFTRPRGLLPSLLGLALTVFNGPLQAAYPAEELDFSLYIEHNETRWEYASETLTSKSSILGVRLQETLAPRLRGSLHAGYVDLSQPDNALAAARFTTGYYGAINLDLLLLDSSALQLTLGGGYRYQDTEGQAEGITVNQVWHDTYAQLQANVPLSRRLALHALGGTSRTSGEQRASGASNQLLTFEEGKQSYYAAGLSYWLDGTGYLRLSWLGGGYEGFRLSFHRGF